MIHLQSQAQKQDDFQVDWNVHFFHLKPYFKGYFGGKLKKKTKPKTNQLQNWKGP